MQSELTKVSAKELRPGMEVLEITRLSTDFSYLDKRLVHALQTIFSGATAIIESNGKKLKGPIDSLSPGDNLISIHDITQITGMNPLSGDRVESMSGLGLLDISISPFQIENTDPNETTGTTETEAPAKAPSVIHTNRNVAGEQVAQAQSFVEKVETAAVQRDKATASVEEVFELARTGKPFMTLAADSVEEIVKMDISSAMSAVAGLKSSGHTYAHSVDMAVILKDVTLGIIKQSGGEVSDTIVRSTLAAGFVHDIGKSAAPLDILDSTDWYPPNSKGNELVRSHPELGAKILTDAGLNETLINVAHYHHVMPDNSMPNSYPDVEFNMVKPLTRLAGIVDSYQAMISGEHREKIVPGKAVENIRSNIGKGYDVGSMHKFLKVIGHYPVGSLVRLSTGDLAFVTHFSAEDSKRPTVVVAENAQGEILSHNPIIDLTENQDIQVREVLDHNEYYNASPGQALEIFSALRVD